MTIERRFGGRSLGLTLRMLFVLALLVAVHAAVLVGLVVLFGVLSGWWLVWLIAAVAALGWAIARRYRSGEGAFLRAAGAEIVDEETQPNLHRTVATLAAMLDVRPPRLAVAQSDVPNAFVVGFTPKRAVIVFSDRTLALLDPEELEAVAAHELAHVASRDAFVMTIAGTARAAGGEMFGREENSWTLILWFFFWPIGALLWGIGTLLTLALSRYREFVADRSAALLTGTPEQLMSALQKLAGDVARIPSADLRVYGGLNVFFIVPVWPRHRLTVLMDHPPLEQRLAALGEIARELGKAHR